MIVRNLSQCRALGQFVARCAERAPNDRWHDADEHESHWMQLRGNAASLLREPQQHDEQAAWQDCGLLAPPGVG